jgi:hypothetical protein
MHWVPRLWLYLEALVRRVLLGSLILIFPESVIGSNIEGEASPEAHLAGPSLVVGSL